MVDKSNKYVHSIWNNFLNLICHRCKIFFIWISAYGDRPYSPYYITFDVAPRQQIICIWFQNILNSADIIEKDFLNRAIGRQQFPLMFPYAYVAEINSSALNKLRWFISSSTIWNWFSIYFLFSHSRAFFCIFQSILKTIIQVYFHPIAFVIFYFRYLIITKQANL